MVFCFRETGSFERYELEKVISRQNAHSSLLEEVGDIRDIFSKEIVRKRMCVLYRLRYIDDYGASFVPKKIVLAEIAVDKVTLLVHPAHINGDSQIGDAKFTRRKIGVFKTFGAPSL
jgi:hypothetical protein